MNLSSKQIKLIFTGIILLILVGCTTFAYFSIFTQSNPEKTTEAENYTEKNQSGLNTDMNVSDDDNAKTSELRAETAKNNEKIANETTIDIDWGKLDNNSLNDKQRQKIMKEVAITLRRMYGKGNRTAKVRDNSFSVDEDNSDIVRLTVDSMPEKNSFDISFNKDSNLVFLDCASTPLYSYVKCEIPPSADILNFPKG